VLNLRACEQCLSTQTQIIRRYRIASLGQSTLTNANLSGTNLAVADFCLSTLTNANLSFADSRGASGLNAAMDNAVFELIPNLGWATGDINFDGAINFDDYSKVDQAFFFQSAPLNHADVAAVPEPVTWLLVAASSLILLAYAARRRKTIQN
jgi:uncharacterized protein YjbI with pentapeptide repeats